MNYHVRIGLEIHVQLNTRTKIFCGCPNSFGAPPNTCVCPVCMGYPGALPVLNREAVRLTAMAGLALGSEVQAVSTFDRKNYFYPDMPKNYQISQYARPFCLGGSVTFESAGVGRTIALTRIHLEEDVAKNIHLPQASGIDFNRAGTPLMEIVTEPELTSPEEAVAFLQALRLTLVYAGVSECNMEQGNLRCDVNCSLAPAGSDKLGVKTEIKNMNTFRGVQKALEAEIRRQCALLEEGREIRQETLRYDPERDRTLPMRSKEYAHDYRYFPEPDLMPVHLDREQIAAWQAALPELPAVRRERFQKEFGLPAYDAGVLTADKDLADFFEAATAGVKQPKLVSNMVMGGILRYLAADAGHAVSNLKVTPPALADLVRLVEESALNSNKAQEVLEHMLASGGEPRAIMREQGWEQVHDDALIDKLAAEVVGEHASVADDYRGGKKAALQFLVGQIMRKSKGKANPRMAMEALRALLDGE